MEARNGGAAAGCGERDGGGRGRGERLEGGSRCRMWEANLRGRGGGDGKNMRDAECASSRAVREKSRGFVDFDMLPGMGEFNGSQNNKRTKRG